LGDFGRLVTEPPDSMTLANPAWPAPLVTIPTTVITIPATMKAIVSIVIVVTMPVAPIGIVVGADIDGRVSERLNDKAWNSNADGHEWMRLCGKTGAYTHNHESGT
jgi:hypothetical protein